MRNSIKDAIIKSCVAVVISGFRAITTHIEKYVVAALIPYMVNQLFTYAEADTVDVVSKDITGENNSSLNEVDIPPS